MTKEFSFGQREGQLQPEHDFDYTVSLMKGMSYHFPKASPEENGGKVAGGFVCPQDGWRFPSPCTEALTRL